MQPRAKSWVPSLKETGVTSPEHWQQLKHCPSPFPALFLGFAAPGREQPQPQRIPSAAAASTHPGPRLSPPWAPTAHSPQLQLRPVLPAHPLRCRAGVATRSAGIRHPSRAAARRRGNKMLLVMEFFSWQKQVFYSHRYKLMGSFPSSEKC